jgi:hypothetical protein
MQSSVKIGQVVDHFQHGFGICKDGTDSSFILVAFKDGSERRVSIQSLADEDGHSFGTPVESVIIKRKLPADRRQKEPAITTSKSRPATRHRFGIRRY